MTKTLVVISGGMDSATALYKAMDETEVIQTLSFDYGQRHVTELSYAGRMAGKLNLPHAIIDLRSIGQFLKGSALSDETVAVPEGHYAEETMKLTIVPNRNTIMLSQAVGAAIGLGADEVWAGMHAGDHPVYPDCRPEFVNALNDLIAIATETLVQVMTPFISIEKSEIAKIGHELGVPYEETWSCYKGGNVHCGRCSTCVERAEAFHIASVPDPTLYEDPDFWKQAVEEFANR